MAKKLKVGDIIHVTKFGHMSCDFLAWVTDVGSNAEDFDWVAGILSCGELIADHGGHDRLSRTENGNWPLEKYCDEWTTVSVAKVPDYVWAAIAKARMLA